MPKYNWAILVLLALTFIRCNAFAPYDTPSGDVEVLSAARACFDQGDFQCAATKYHVLELSTSASTLDQAYSEDAFEILAQNGIGFSTFMAAILNSSGNAVGLINQLAGTLRTRATTNPLQTSSYSTRTALFGAYQKSLNMSNGRSRGLIKFITATTLLAEILAEDASGVTATTLGGILKQSDIVTAPATCLASKGNYPWTGCTPPATATIVDGTGAINLPTATSTTFSTAPNLQMILAASSEVQAGLATVAPSGGIGSSSASFATSIIQQAIGTPSGSPLLRYTLISLGIGAKP